MAANDKQCENCQFYYKEGRGADTAQCRCNAPHPSLKSSLMSDKFYSDAVITWPTVQPTNWCGQYKEKKH